MNSKKTPEELLKQSLALFREPSTEAMESASDRVRARLTSEAGSPRKDAAPAPTVRRPLLFFAAAVAVGVVAVVVGMTIRPKVEVQDGVSRVSMKQIESHEAFRSENRTGTTLVLPDDSRVEMRVGTELSFDRTADGLRILLEYGSILVSAAKQRAGHLYVRTKDVNVSVVGTVFLVKAEQQGSSVAVIEGEVRVQKGATEKNLRPGEQLASNPVMERLPIKEEIAWSREAETHVAQLQQSAVAGTEERPAFEVVSIRPTPPADTSGGRGAGPLPGQPCTGNVNVDPARFVVTNVTLYNLITLAYGTAGRECTYYSRTGLLSGGPVWITMDRFDVQAVIPPGSASYTKEQVQNGDAPRLQAMLRTLLADRSRLVVRREMKEVPGYALKLGTTRDAAQLSESGTKTLRDSPINYTGIGPQDTFVGVVPIYRAPSERPSTGDRSSGRIILGRNESLQELTQRLASLVGRPVVNQTGLTGKFSYEVGFDIDHDALPGTQALTRPLNDGSISALRRALEQQLGLKLEATRATVETLVIEQVEKPSEN